jgi:hypothetical protein
MMAHASLFARQLLLRWCDVCLFVFLLCGGTSRCYSWIYRRYTFWAPPPPSGCKITKIVIARRSRKFSRRLFCTLMMQDKLTHPPPSPKFINRFILAHCIFSFSKESQKSYRLRLAQCTTMVKKDVYFSCIRDSRDLNRAQLLLCFCVCGDDRWQLSTLPNVSPPVRPGKLDPRSSSGLGAAWVLILPLPCLDMGYWRSQNCNSHACGFPLSRDAVGFGSLFLCLCLWLVSGFCLRAILGLGLGSHHTIFPHLSSMELRGKFVSYQP